ncbi:MAG: ATP-binding protein [Elusimicrobiota bacterium]
MDDPRKEPPTSRQAMRQSLARMERFSAVGRMAAAFAHDMRTPLHVIASTAETALQFLSPAPELRESLEMILRNARTASASVQALLDFTKTGRPQLRRASLNDILRSASDLVAGMCRAQGVSLSLELGELPPLMLDEQHLRAVAHNILVNAVEATSAGGSLRVRTEPGPEAVVLTVSDTGAGMTPEALSKAGTPFFTTKESGTGLGLYLSKRILAEHGASLSLESELGKGTTVRVFFPVVLLKNP